jgi:mono/diheme cytochrome c family protein
MRAKAQQVASAEPEAAVAVTKPVRTATLLCSMAVLLVGYQNCSVDMSQSTPGASTFVCAPSAPQMTDFISIEQSLLTASGNVAGTTKQNCGGCHTTGGSGAGQYSMKLNPSSDPALSLANFCTTAAKGASMDIVFTSGHGGGSYTEAELPALATFIDTWF